MPFRRIPSEKVDKREKAGEMVGNGCPLKGEISGDAQGILMGNSCCEGCPLKGKMMGLCREGKWAEKLQKLIFSKLEIVLKMDISRQTK